MGYVIAGIGIAYGAIVGLRLYLATRYTCYLWFSLGAFMAAIAITAMGFLGERLWLYPLLIIGYVVFTIGMCLAGGPYWDRIKTLRQRIGRINFALGRVPAEVRMEVIGPEAPKKTVKKFLKLLVPLALIEIVLILKFSNRRGAIVSIALPLIVIAILTLVYAIRARRSG